MSTVESKPLQSITNNPKKFAFSDAKCMKAVIDNRNGGSSPQKSTTTTATSATTTKTSSCSMHLTRYFNTHTLFSCKSNPHLQDYGMVCKGLNPPILQ